MVHRHVPARDAGERAATLTRQLLAFSRQQVLEPTVLDVNVLIESMDKMLRRLIGEDVEVVTHLGADLGHVRADAGQVEQVLVNLAINARDAMPSGGKLTIETANVELDGSGGGRSGVLRAGRYVLLAVTDTGCGMDAATQERIFELFFTTKPVGRGTGLGLATVYGIVKQSGGDVWVYSEPGRGSTFKVYLPTVAAKVEPARVLEPVGSVAGDEIVLLVEDDSAVRDSLARTLRHAGYMVLEAADGDEALRIVEEWGMAIDVVVTDVIMPGRSGRDVVRAIEEGHGPVRALYLSGFPDHAVVRGGELEPGLAFLNKPVRAATLLARLRQLLDTPAAAG